MAECDGVAFDYEAIAGHLRRAQICALADFCELLREKYMKKTILALALATFALNVAAPAFAAEDKPCNPPKEGHVLDKDGKCVAKKK